MSVRDDRLHAEFEAMQLFNSTVMRIERVEGSPWPDIYYLFYDLTSIVSWNGGTPSYHSGFSVRINMPLRFPSKGPTVHFISQPYPVHPNIWPDGRICYTDKWPRYIGIPLVNICEMVGQIISYQKMNINDPANPKVLTIVQSNRHLFPTDKRQIRLPDRTNPAQPLRTQSRIKFGAGG
jgi:ubiquitin-protein ligase